MDIKAEIDKFRIINENCEDAYLLDELKKSFQFNEFNRNLIIWNNDNEVISFAFFKWQSGECPGNDTVKNEGELYWYGCGMGEGLRELRHSYLNEYIFYLDTEFMIECCNWLKQYFD